MHSLYKAYNCHRVPAAPIGVCMKCDVCRESRVIVDWAPDHWPQRSMCLNCLDAVLELLNWRERVGKKDFSMLTAAAEAILRSPEPEELEHDVSNR